MGNLKIFDNIKKLFNKNIYLNNNMTNIERTISPEFGFQLIKSDLSPYLQNFLTKGQKKERLEMINNYGYLSNETGLILKDMIDDPNYDTYLKSVHSKDIDSIMEEGVRCLGTTSSISTTNPKSIDEIALEETVSKVDDLTILIDAVKSDYGLSPAFNPIDGSIILQIPKDVTKEEMFCYNENSSTYNIKPEFIVGFLPVNEEHKVSDFIYREKSNNKAI